MAQILNILFLYLKLTSRTQTAVYPYIAAFRMKTSQEIHHMGTELTDRFGPLPESVINLFEIIILKRLAEKAHIEKKPDIGPSAIVFSFYKNIFPKSCRDGLGSPRKSSRQFDLRPRP